MQDLLQAFTRSELAPEIQGARSKGPEHCSCNAWWLSENDEMMKS